MQEHLELLEGLEATIRQSPMLYDAHTQYISLLKMFQLDSRLMAAYATMHENFLLPPGAPACF